MSMSNYSSFDDVTGDDIEIQLHHGEHLYLKCHQDGKEEVVFRFDKEESIRIRDHILKMFPLEETVEKDSAMSVVGEVVDFPRIPGLTINIGTVNIQR